MITGLLPTKHTSPPACHTNSTTHHYNHDMTTILDTHARAVTSHQQYLDSLQTPTPAEVERISEIQILKAEEINRKYHVHTTEERDAAIKIQAMYRGHRGRREQQGLVLDPSSRWTDLIADLKYRSVTEPHHNQRTAGSTNGRRVPSPSEAAKLNWRRAGWIAEHAGRGESSASSQRTASDMSNASTGKSDDGQEEVTSMMMDLRYFLEMVDSKHRYGANLQVYHEYWKRQATTQNFFYWLDHGAGKHLDLSLCSREKLDREQIRYLSREERKDYLVEVDDEGRLRWAKNGELITTSVDDFKDSTRGIIPVGTPDPQPLDNPDQTSTEANAVLAQDLRRLSLSGFNSNSSDDEESSSSSSINSSSTKPANNNNPPNKPKPFRRIHVSPATLLNHLLRSSVKPGTWIYVTDTLNRLYVGIKSSGAFQHASFLSGSRIRSAGSISVENGQLTYLSPLSGHYRPTTQSFRTFLESLDDQGVDLSGLKVSGAYKVLIGLELYGRTKKGLTKVRRVGRREKRAKGEGRKERVAVELVHESEGVSATELVEKHWEREHAHHHHLHGRMRSKG
jgi:hypothetical protein